MLCQRKYSQSIGEFVFCVLSNLFLFVVDYLSSLPFDREPHSGGPQALRPGGQQALGLPTAHLDEEGVTDLK